MQTTTVGKTKTSSRPLTRNSTCPQFRRHRNRPLLMPCQKKSHLHSTIPSTIPSTTSNYLCWIWAITPTINATLFLFPSLWPMLRPHISPWHSLMLPHVCQPQKPNWPRSYANRHTLCCADAPPSSHSAKAPPPPFRLLSLCHLSPRSDPTAHKSSSS
jgi:hypothetical protein